MGRVGQNFGSVGHNAFDPSNNWLIWTCSMSLTHMLLRRIDQPERLARKAVWMFSSQVDRRRNIVN